MKYTCIFLCEIYFHLWNIENYFYVWHQSVQSLSHVQLCNPMNHSMLGLLVHHQLPPKSMSIELVIQSNHLILCRPLFLMPAVFPCIMFFSNESALCIRCQSTGVSALSSILPMNTQDWSPLGWTGWISLQSKGLSRIFSNNIVQKHQFSALSFLYSPILTSTHDHWKNHNLD